MIGKDVCIINNNVREAIQLSIQRENDKSWTKLEERTQLIAKEIETS